MFFSTVLVIIREVFDMLKGSPKATNRWSIVARKSLQHDRDLEALDDDIAEHGHENSHSVYDRLAEGRRDTELDVVPQDTKLVEQNHVALQVYPSSHSLRRMEFHSPSTARAAMPKDLTFHARFHQVWHHQEIIGEGGDGVVHLYQLSDDHGMYVAVKVPRCCSAREDVEKEIINMRLIGKHENILELFFASNEWYPYGPAMFIPYCELGSLIDYRNSWCVQQAWDGQPERVSEVTMWKLFRDMILALNFLHNELGIRYIHNDFKPANVLAIVPSDDIQCRKLPEEPTFKLSDFARLTPWPTPRGKPARRFDGTPEYAPPRHEQRAPVLPSADIWGLGATLQYLALGINPVQSKKAFIRDRKAKGKPHPELKDKSEWLSEHWRTRVPTVFRPLNVPVKVLQTDYDLSCDLPDYQHYGACLGYWYAQLWKPVTTRPKASKLMTEAIPHMDDVVKRLKRERIK